MHIDCTLCFFYPDCCRVLNAIRYWVEHHYYDFQDDASLLDDLMAFLVTIRGNNLKKWIESIHRTLQRQVCEQGSVLWNCNYPVVCGYVISDCILTSAWWTWYASTDGCGVLQQCSCRGMAPVTEPRWLWPCYGGLLEVFWHLTHGNYVSFSSPNVVASIGDCTSIDSHWGRIFQVCAQWHRLSFMYAI